MYLEKIGSKFCSLHHMMTMRLILKVTNPRSSQNIMPPKRWALVVFYSLMNIRRINAQIFKYTCLSKTPKYRRIFSTTKILPIVVTCFLSINYGKHVEPRKAGESGAKRDVMLLCYLNLNSRSCIVADAAFFLLSSFY